jgi:predicted ATPase
VTFLFTDVEGSTRLLHSLGAEAYADALGEHRRLIREACAGEGGVEVDMQGDGSFFAFPTAPGALAAASTLTQALASGPIAVRVGVHTGTPLLTAEGYVGGDVHRAARIAAAGHGGQVLVSASTAQLVDLELTDLGQHRLKDLSAPERVFQLGGGDFAALKSLYRTNLPIPATPFLGREQELSEVVELLSADDARLLTLTGPGGAGKTRLALQAAGLASDAYPDGVWWIPLAALRDSDLVLPTAARLLGSKNGIAEHIADRYMLCLFDNFEQVVEAAPDLATLVSACPNLDVLVTSRERLRVSGEQTYPVPPLAESDGEALFAARARAVDPSFVPSGALRELCLRLDELPLALELAAARTSIFSPEQLLSKLSHRLDLLSGDRDADPRQETLRATIEWSHKLLSEKEQRLFRGLAVFAGGSTYEAAEEIVGADPNTLQSLLDKSLVRRRDLSVGPRYWMLETIREFASERLDAASEREGVRQRHADFYFALAHRAEPELEQSDQLAWLDRLEAELDNLRAALDYAQDAGRSEDALRAFIAMRRFLDLRVHVDEVRRRSENLLSVDQPPALRAAGLRDLAQAAAMQGDADRAWELMEERLELYRALNDDVGVHRTLQALALFAAQRGDVEQAHALITPVVDWARGVSDYELTYPLHTLTEILFEEGRYNEALAASEEALAACERLGDDLGLAIALGGIGSAYLYMDRVDEALPHLRMSFLGWRALGNNVEVLGLFLPVIALVSSMRGESQRAARLLGKADELIVTAGRQSDSSLDTPYKRASASAREALGQKRFEAAYLEGRAMSLDDALELGREVLDDA